MLSRCSAGRRLGAIATAVGAGSWLIANHYDAGGQHIAAGEALATMVHRERMRLPLLLPQPARCEAPASSGAAKQPPVISIDPKNYSPPLPADAGAKLKEVRDRFKAYASGPLEVVGARLKKEKNGVKIFTLPKGGFQYILDPEAGLPYARIGEVLMGVPAERVAELWWAFSERKGWDSSTQDSVVVEDYDPDTRLVYLKAAPKPLISSRDTVFVAHKLRAAELGAWSGSYAFIQVDASEILPHTQGAVRASINSALIVEPVDSRSCRVRYLVEVDPRGWIPGIAVEAAADDLPGILWAVKQAVEAKATQ